MTKNNFESNPELNINVMDWPKGAELEEKKLLK
jgi:hypothetical protein